MSFETELQSAVIAALKAHGAIAAQANGVFLERPVRASAPYLVLGEMLSADWSVKGAAGREVRVIVRVHDLAEGWSRAIALQAAAGEAIEGLPRILGGWRIGSVTFLRGRSVREASGGWLATAEYRIRGMED